MRKTTYLRVKKLTTWFLGTICILCALYLYFYTGTFTIQTYSFSGVPEDRVEDLTNNAKLIAENTLYRVLPGNRTISYHDNELRTLIGETLPTSKIITIYPWGLHTLVIKVVPYTPLFSVSDTHAISDDGTVYKEIIPLDQFPRLEVASSSEVLPRTLKEISELITRVDAVLFPISYVVVDEFNDIRLYNKEKNSFIAVSNASNMDMVWSNVLSAVDTEPLKGKLLDPTEHLEYIDTRFGNKVFYKFINKAAPAHEDTPVATTTIQ
ncbi:MAG: hypothetical protein RIQ41_230 [Candidatus Parcubacteria bacterium]|jgi:hypothetical protein